MKIVLLDSQTLGDIDLKSFYQLGDFVAYPTTTIDQLYERIKDAQIVLTNKVPFQADILHQCPQLKLIAVTATGTDMIDIECAKKLNIVVKNVVDYSTKSVAQHTLTLVLNLLSQINYYDQYCKNGAWVESEIFTHIDKGLEQLYSKEWGIIGLGTIGKEVAKIAECFGAKISYTSTSNHPQKDCFYSYKALDELLSSSDIISIHAPLHSKTRNLLDSKKLSLIKDGGILVNVGRGGIVNEEDIAQELIKRDIYFATDVLAQEPMQKNHPFLNPILQQKLMITPHIAWAYKKSREALIQKVIANIKEFLN